MNIKKYYMVIVSLILMIMPFALLAQQTDNAIAPNTYRLDDIIGSPIVIQGAAGAGQLENGANEQMNNGATPSPSPMENGDSLFDLFNGNGNGMTPTPSPMENDDALFFMDNGTTPTPTPMENGDELFFMDEGTTPTPMPTPTMMENGTGGASQIQYGGEDATEDEFGLENGTDNVPLEIGDVNDLVINEQGQVTHVVANLRENRGWDWWTGGGMYLVPADMFSVRSAEDELVLEISQLQNMTIPRVESEDALQQLLETGSVQATRFKDFNVVGLNGEELGYIEDLVVNMEQKEISYAALAVGGFLGVGTELYAVPFEEIQFDKSAEQITVETTQEQLNNREPFDAENWPQSATP